MKAILLLLALDVMVLAQTPSPGAMVFGKVQSAAGAPIAGAWVTIYRDVTDSRAAVPHFTAATPAWKGGVFAFDGLDAGSYHFCATLPGSTWLNPCDWDSKRVSVDVKPNQMVRGVVVVMKPGVAVPIRVDDPNQLLSKYGTSTPGAHVLIGVSTVSGLFQPATLLGDDGKGRNHQVVIPFDSPTTVAIRSDHFLMTDSTGKAVANGSANGPVSVPTGNTPSQIKVTISGFRP